MLTNKTYKLFGTIWDKLDIANDIKYMDDDSYINEYDDDFNLFDNKSIRKINISRLLGINDYEYLNEIVSNLKSYHEILISIDYVPLNNKTIRKFYNKRVLQIYKYFVDNISDSIIYISSNIKDQLQC